jgi:hypothetical protein
MGERAWETVEQSGSPSTSAALALGQGSAPWRKNADLSGLAEGFMGWLRLRWAAPWRSDDTRP